MATATMSPDMSQNVDVQVAALDAKSIRSIQLPSGWQNVSDCQLTQFAVGTAHSPISPTKVYAALRYRDQSGRQVFTPLSQILSFSQDTGSNSR
jgi:hypothetical protein